MLYLKSANPLERNEIVMLFDKPPESVLSSYKEHAADSMSFEIFSKRKNGFLLHSPHELAWCPC